MKELSLEFLELSKRYEKLTDEVNKVREEMLKKMKELGENFYLQDEETLAVYKIVKPEGHYVFYKELDYVRTILGDEKRGSLSKKEAEEQGFILKK